MQTMLPVKESSKTESDLNDIYTFNSDFSSMVKESLRMKLRRLVHTSSQRTEKAQEVAKKIAQEIAQEKDKLAEKPAPEKIVEMAAKKFAVEKAKELAADYLPLYDYIKKSTKGLRNRFNACIKENNIAGLQELLDTTEKDYINKFIAVCLAKRDAETIQYLAEPSIGMIAEWKYKQTSEVIADLPRERYLVHARNEETRDTVLHEVIKNKRLTPQILQLFFDRGFERDSKNRIGQTLLHYAASYQPEVLSLLLENDFDANAKDDEGNTALHHLIKEGNFTEERFALFLKHGFKPNNENNKKQTLLHYTAMYQSDYLLFLLKEGFEINAKDKFGNTALHYLIKHGTLDERTLALYILKGFDITNANHTGQTLLHCAAVYEKPELFSLLLKHIDANIKNIDGKTALHFLIIQGKLSEKILTLFLDYLFALDNVDNDGKTLLHYATMYQPDRDLLSLLLEKKFNVNAKDKSGNTALHFLIMQGNLTKEILASFLEYGFTLNIENQNLLSYAAKYQPDCISLLLEAGFDVNAKDKVGNTAIHYLVSEGTLTEEIFNLCLSRGFKLSNANHKGQTILLCAAVYQKSALLSFLLKHFDANAQNDEGKTTLHFLIMQGKFTEIIFNLFLDNGFKVNNPDNKGRTILHYAAMYQPKILKMLLDSGRFSDSNFNVNDKTGHTVLYYLTQHNDDAYTEIVLQMRRLGADVASPIFDFSPTQAESSELPKPLFADLGGVFDQNENAAAAIKKTNHEFVQSCQELPPPGNFPEETMLVQTKQLVDNNLPVKSEVLFKMWRARNKYDHFEIPNLHFPTRTSLDYSILHIIKTHPKESVHPDIFQFLQWFNSELPFKGKITCLWKKALGKNFNESLGNKKEEIEWLFIFEKLTSFVTAGHEHYKGVKKKENPNQSKKEKQNQKNDSISSLEEFIRMLGSSPLLPKEKVTVLYARLQRDTEMMKKNSSRLQFYYSVIIDIFNKTYKDLLDENFLNVFQETCDEIYRNYKMEEKFLANALQELQKNNEWKAFYQRSSTASGRKDNDQIVEKEKSEREKEQSTIKEKRLPEKKSDESEELTHISYEEWLCFKETAISLIKDLKRQHPLAKTSVAELAFKLCFWMLVANLELNDLVDTTSNKRMSLSISITKVLQTSLMSRDIINRLENGSYLFEQKYCRLAGEGLLKLAEPIAEGESKFKAKNANAALVINSIPPEIREYCIQAQREFLRDISVSLTDKSKFVQRLDELSKAFHVVPESTRSIASKKPGGPQQQLAGPVVKELTTKLEGNIKNQERTATQSKQSPALFSSEKKRPQTDSASSRSTQKSDSLPLDPVAIVNALKENINLANFFALWILAMAPNWEPQEVELKELKAFLLDYFFNSCGQVIFPKECHEKLSEGSIANLFMKLQDEKAQEQKVMLLIKKAVEVQEALKSEENKKPKFESTYKKQDQPARRDSFFGIKPLSNYFGGDSSGAHKSSLVISDGDICKGLLAFIGNQGLPQGLPLEQLLPQGCEDFILSGEQLQNLITKSKNDNNLGKKLF